ncbi:MAG: hypothetical protein LBG99_03440 [Propionibacteriaceae bacterium]|jgi:hypothetical protein|nr:hypothetical protein [Propionibacteriaceae bacterium]
MAYTVVRVRLQGWTDKFQDFESDTDFGAQAYPGLDNYLSTMEIRGWTVVNTAVASTGAGIPAHLMITLHRPDA